MYVIYPITFFSNKKRVICLGTRNLHELKVRRYTAYMIDIIAYLDALQGEKASDKIGEMELNEIILKSIPNGWSKQAYVQGIDCKTSQNE